MRSSDRIGALLAASLLLAAAPAWALSQVPGPIEIGPSWGAADTASHAASLYTTIINRGVLADRLVGGHCAGFGDVSLAGLEPATQGDSADEKGVLIPAGATARLSPDAAHLALANADRASAPGALISCTLNFVHSGQRLVIFRIGGAGPAVQEP